MTSFKSFAAVGEGMGGMRRRCLADVQSSWGAAARRSAGRAYSRDYAQRQR